MRFGDERPQLTPARKTYTYISGTQGVADQVAPRVLNRAHSFTADVEIPKGGAQGVIVCHGSNQGGYTLFVQDGKLNYVHNYVGIEEFRVVSNEKVPEGKVKLRYEFEPTGKPDIEHGKGTPGRGQLYINDKLVGQTDFPVTVPLQLGLGSGLAVGRNPGASVTSLYKTPFAFTGRINSVVVDVSGKMIQDTEEEERAFAKAAMARQ
jgi:arylsulfatase